MNHSSKAAMTGEERERFFARRKAAMKGSPDMSTVLPAQENFDVIAFYSNGTTFREMRSPVVGWTARPGAVAKPVMPTEMPAVVHFDNVRHARVCVVQFFRGLRIGDGKQESHVRQAVTQEHAAALHAKATAHFDKLDNAAKNADDVSDELE